MKIENDDRVMIDSNFEYHFNILDSVAKTNPNEITFACCSQSIKFMEDNTGIEANSDGTLVGKLIFSKEDLRKWHEWYDKKYKKEK